MLRTLLSGNQVQIMGAILAYAVIIFTALPIHEFTHGFIAKKLGDPTATNLGRLTLNPFAHFDPIGTTALVLFGFGWAKPVPVNPFYFKNRKNGMALTALGGPLANFLLATVSLLILKCIAYFAPNLLFFSLLGTVMQMIAQVNISLAAFNLIPLPPLDGSKIIGFFLPQNIYARFEMFFARYQQIIFYAMVVLLFVLPNLGGPFAAFSNIINIPFNAFWDALYWLADHLTGFVDLIAKVII